MEKITSLRTSDLAVGYEGVPLISEVEFTLHKGEILTLIGPNGAGKSTILKTIAKYLKPVSGTAYIGEQDLGAMTPKDLSTQMSVVLTGRISTELMTCRDVVETGRYPYTGRLGILNDEDRAVVERSMALVNVTEIAERDFTQISDGQRQRVLLARAICQEPDIIVLDEPTSFLDVHYKLELLGLLRSLAKTQGIAVIMSLHELDLAQKVSDTIMCVKGDRILRYGTPQDIFTRELIIDLYDLDNGSYDPLFGSVEMARVQGNPVVFALAGAGVGTQAFRLMQRERIPFAAGVLFENDIDFALASDLAAKLISSKPFLPASEEALQAARCQIDACAALLMCDDPAHPMHEANKALYEYALQQGKRMLYGAADLTEETCATLRELLDGEDA